MIPGFGEIVEVVTRLESISNFVVLAGVDLLLFTANCEDEDGFKGEESERFRGMKKR